MKLLSIAVFLDLDNFNDLNEKAVSEEMVVTNFEVTEKGIKYKCFEIEMSGIGLVFLPSNDFHKECDFEIGISVLNNNEWEKTVKTFKNIEHRIIQNEESPISNYILFGDNDNHGPFFLVKEKKYSSVENLIKLEADIGGKEKELWDNQLITIFPEEFRRIMNFNVNNENSFQIKRIYIKASEEQKISILKTKCTTFIKKKDSTEIIFGN